MDDVSDRFAPLTDEERAAAGPKAAADDEWTVVTPVPAPANSLRPFVVWRVEGTWKKPDATWPYRDGEERLLGYACRWDLPPKYDGEKPDKEFSFAAWCRNRKGECRWKLKHLPAPRPLYNLDKLAARSDAPVVICEGEKSADAAARVFPNSVCITSPGGSRAAAQADWTPLSGRKVRVWPDHDEVGEKYAAEIARILHGLESEVSVIDAAALASCSPDGGKREPIAKWDAADAVDEWSDLEALRKAAALFAKLFDPAPAFVSWGAFTMKASGLTQETMKGRSDNGETVTEWIAAPFEIIGRARDPHGVGWGRFLRWRDPDGRTHERFVSDGALHGDPASLSAGLADGGLSIARNQQRAFASYLAGANVHGRVTMVYWTGWHEIGGHLAFVLPAETIGPKGAGAVILDAAAHGPYDARGKLVDWQQGVGALASGHALAVLAISAALAGPLLQLATQEGGGLNFFGPSSTGKTTLLQAAASVWGRGTSPGYIRTWRATANGLEGAAAGATDTALVLDELGVVEARDAAAAFYGLANGSGKARAARDGTLREPKSWRVLILSSGEVPAETKLLEDRGRKARAGQLVRMLDIPADGEKGYGAFDNAGPEGEAGKLAKALKLAASASYGTAGPEFVRRLIAEDVTGEDVRALVAEVTPSEVPTHFEGQIGRAAQRLGLIAAAGELATALGVTPWREGEAREAAAWALGQWIDLRGGTEPAEVRQAVEQVRLFIEAHGESRFEPVDDPEARPVNNRAGWRKGSGAAREWMIPSETWKAEICQGLDPKLVARVLAERGMLLRATDGFQPVRKIGGANKRVYVLTAKIFDGGDDEESIPKTGVAGVTGVA